MSSSVHVIAHRGASGLAGEDNTLRSFELAIELGCDYVEFDVRRTRDALVCFHDASVEGVEVSELTLSELRQRTGKAVPHLEEVLQLCGHAIGLDVEIKPPGIEREVVAALRQVDCIAPVLVKCFDVDVVRQLVSMRAGYAVGLLAGPESRVGTGDPLTTAIAACRDLDADFLSPHHSLLEGRPPNSDELRRVTVYPWTVNDEALMAKLTAMPIDGLITDRPDLLMKHVSGARRSR